MNYLASASLLVVGLIHLIPVTGAFSAERLASLYGVVHTEPDLVILMRHRAVLFGLLGMFLVYAAARPSAQPLAFGAGFVSVVSFLFLCWSTTSYNAHIARVVAVDVFAFGCLIVGSAAYIYTRLLTH